MEEKIIGRTIITVLSAVFLFWLLPKTIEKFSLNTLVSLGFNL